MKQTISKPKRPKRYVLSAQQAQALEMLMAGQTVTETAAALGIARETVSRWRSKDPTFKAAYNDALKSSWEASRTRLLEARVKAVNRLIELIDSENEAMALKACMALMRFEVKEPGGHTDPADIEEWNAAFAALYR